MYESGKLNLEEQRCIGDVTCMNHSENKLKLEDAGHCPFEDTTWHSNRETRENH
jgi:hypothetical protein